MGTITAGTGLISGIDIAGLIDQLIALESRPRQLVERRNVLLTTQQTAFQDVNAKLLGLKFSVDTLTGSTSFTATTATTSNESVLTVTSKPGAVTGNYGFTVDRLVSSQQVLTKGFKDSNATPVGTGTLTFESGKARLDSKTLLSNLNGGTGVTRGLIRVTDRSGAVSLIDLSRAVTIDDVIQTINSSIAVSVLATVTGDTLTITDNTGLGAGSITITDVGTTATAASLGIVGTDATGVITGTQINSIGRDTLLAAINDGQGVDIRDDVTSSEFTITDGAGTKHPVNLLNETTLGEVIDTINAATSGLVIASIAADGVSLTLTDTTGGGIAFKVAAGTTSSTAAADLGLLGDDEDGDSQINGERIIASINSKLLSKLNGGAGIGMVGQLTTTTLLADLFLGAGISTTGNISREIIVIGNGGTYSFDADLATTAGDLINLINTNSLGQLTFAITGNAFTLTDNVAGAANLEVFDNPLFSATMVADLGLTTNTPTGTVTGVNTQPVPTVPGAGTVDFQDRAGVTFSVDLSTAKSVSDVFILIDAASAAAGAGITADLNRAGNGITITDSSGGAGDIIISDTNSTAAASLNIVGTFSADEVESGNLQYQYITLGTRLDSIGFVKGKIKITDSTGSSFTVSLQETEQTLADVIQDINGSGLRINARINDNGDGIILEDTNAGTQAVAISVEEAGSGTAASLGLLGEATNPGDDFDGSFEKTVGFTSDTMIGTTLLTALKSGNGIDFDNANPDFKVTTANGNTFDVDITAGDLTIADLIANIEAASDSTVTVAIDEAGTKLILTDTTTGSARFSFDALNNSEALSDLGFKDDTDGDGKAKSGTLVKITTLRDLVSLINEADVGVDASIINDGSAGVPFRLILSADKSGSAGAFIFDDGGAGFKASTFNQAQDAIVFFGSTDPAQAQIITSTSNTLENVIPGATITLLATSDQPVQITISQDDQAAISAAQSFVDGFNNLMSTIDTYDSFNSDSEERGLLLGDSALVQLKSRLFSAILRRSADLSGSFTSLVQVGIRIGGGTTLKLDTAKFQAALDTDRDAVVNLFTFKETETDDDGKIVTTARGVGVAIDELLERLTDTDFGIIESRVSAIDRQIELNQDRIDQLNAALVIKRARLEAQFIAMERALAQLQGQSAVLASFQPITFASLNSR